MVQFPDIGHTIQLSLSPVFLLAGISGFLNVLAQRLARVVDRVRALEREFTPLEHPRHAGQVEELRLLDRRITLGSWALFLCTASAALICAIIAGLFVARLAHKGFGGTMAITFIVAMMMLIGGLGLFLIEVRLALRQIRVREDLLERGEAGVRRRPSPLPHK